MSNFHVGDKVMIVNYDEGNHTSLNGKLGIVTEVGLDDMYYVKIENRHYCIADHEMVLASKDNKFEIFSQVIVNNPNSTFHNQIGHIVDIKYQLDDSVYRYYVRFSKDDDCSFFFTVDEINIFDLSSLFSQTTVDILS